MKLVAGDAKLFGPVSNIGGHFGVNLFEVVRALGDVGFVRAWGSEPLGALWCSDIRCILSSFPWFDDPGVCGDVLSLARVKIHVLHRRMEFRLIAGVAEPVQA